MRNTTLRRSGVRSWLTRLALLAVMLAVLPSGAVGIAAAPGPSIAGGTDDFGTVNIGGAQAIRHLELLVSGIQFTSFVISGPNPSDFAVSDNSCLTKAVSDSVRSFLGSVN